MTKRQPLLRVLAILPCGLVALNQLVFVAGREQPTLRGQEAALAGACNHVFPMWQQARMHMRGEKSTELGSSWKKGKLIPRDAVHANDPFKGKLIVAAPPTEAEIASLLEKFNRRCPDPKTFRKHASAHLRGRFGHFAFATFGYGTLSEFLFRHGFPTLDVDAMDKETLWMDDVPLHLAPCQRCGRALPREKFSRRQLRKWDTKFWLARPHCRACLESQDGRKTEMWIWK